MPGYEACCVVPCGLSPRMGVTIVNLTLNPHGSQVVRMVVDALVALARRERIETSLQGAGRLLQVNVFISDFHADRMKAALDWVFGLEPSHDVERLVAQHVTSVSSKGVQWGSDPEIYRARMEHEANGAQ